MPRRADLAALAQMRSEQAAKHQADKDAKKPLYEYDGPKKVKLTAAKRDKQYQDWIDELTKPRKRRFEIVRFLTVGQRKIVVDCIREDFDGVPLTDLAPATRTAIRNKLSMRDAADGLTTEIVPYGEI